MRATPTLTLAPSQSQWGQSGSTVAFMVTVTNTDTAGYPGSTFVLQAAPPGRRAAGFTAPTLGPGVSAAPTPQVTAPATAAEGFYPRSVAATNRDYPTASVQQI